MMRRFFLGVTGGGPVTGAAVRSRTPLASGVTFGTGLRFEGVAGHLERLEERVVVERDPAFDRRRRVGRVPVGEDIPHDTVVPLTNEEVKGARRPHRGPENALGRRAAAVDEGPESENLHVGQLPPHVRLPAAGGAYTIDKGADRGVVLVVGMPATRPMEQSIIERDSITSHAVK